MYQLIKIIFNLFYTSVGFRVANELRTKPSTIEITLTHAEIMTPNLKNFRQNNFESSLDSEFKLFEVLVLTGLSSINK